MQSLRTALNTIRDSYYPVNRTSNFRETGEITPEEFIIAGDYLVYKFPSWSWSGASTPSKKVSYLPDNKQFLVTRSVPCRQRLGGQGLAGGAELNEVFIAEGEGDEEWLSTGGEPRGLEERAREVKSIDNSGKLADAVGEEDEIPDMEDDDDDEDAIIRETSGTGDVNESLRTYNLYIMYSPYYRTPRLYLSGYSQASTPLAPEKMMEDIVGDYKDKTVTLEPFPFLDSALRMASIHPCRHAAVMKILLDRADAALKLRVEKVKAGKADSLVKGMEGLEVTPKLTAAKSDLLDSSRKEGEEWEVLQQDESAEDEVAIRVDQYLVVFLKFMASVTPGIEHDFTMGV